MVRTGENLKLGRGLFQQPSVCRTRFDHIRRTVRFNSQTARTSQNRYIRVEGEVSVPVQTGSGPPNLATIILFIIVMVYGYTWQISID